MQMGTVAPAVPAASTDEQPVRKSVRFQWLRIYRAQQGRGRSARFSCSFWIVVAVLGSHDRTLRPGRDAVAAASAAVRAISGSARICSAAMSSAAFSSGAQISLQLGLISVVLGGVPGHRDRPRRRLCGREDRYAALAVHRCPSGPSEHSAGARGDRGARPEHPQRDDLGRNRHDAALCAARAQLAC